MAGGWLPRRPPPTATKPGLPLRGWGKVSDTSVKSPRPHATSGVNHPGDGHSARVVGAEANAPIGTAPETANRLAGPVEGLRPPPGLRPGRAGTRVVV